MDIHRYWLMAMHCTGIYGHTLLLAYGHAFLLAYGIVTGLWPRIVTGFETKNKPGMQRHARKIPHTFGKYASLSLSLCLSVSLSLSLSLSLSFYKQRTSINFAQNNETAV